MTEPTPRLNPQQEEAIRYSGGPSLVVAGPGSGKTKVLTHKIARLIKEGMDPQKILAVTFTNKAADEMQERVTGLLGPQGTGKNRIPQWMGTFHSVCVRILRTDGREIGISAGFVIYDQGDQRSLIKDLLKEQGPSGEKFSAPAIHAAISNAKNELVDSEEYETLASGPFEEAAAAVFGRYQAELTKANALDFDDLLFKTVLLLRTKPKVARRWQERFDHILVDEYQDTNRAQYEIIKTLSQNHQNLTVVGDMSQAIYSWRGADFRNILRFEKDYPRSKIFRLGQNYRSTQKILSAAQALIKHNRTHLPIDLWTGNQEGIPPTLYSAADEVDEAHYISSQLTAMIQGGEAQSFSDFAVLYRTNAQSRVLEEVFMRSGIPYVLVGGVKFYERREIKDVLGYLRLIMNPRDRVSLKRVQKIGKRRFAKFLKIDKLDRRPVIILDEILAKTGYLTYLEDGTEEGQSRIENVKELRSVASSFGSLAEFLEHVALVQPTDSLTFSGKGGAVALMTLHSAKGLEFPTVFITGLEEGLLPHSRSLGNWESLEEERRLCYVGITRAKQRVHLCFAQERLFFGTRAMGIPSRFLNEIGEENMIFHLGQRDEEF